MTKTKVTKKALASSLLALMLCVSMLLGTTYAWFTDSVTSGGNKIVAGTLDIDLYQWTDANTSVEITDISAPIFGSGTSTVAQNVNSNTLWEPGKTQIAYLSIKNNGSLWLKYTVALVVKNVSKDLYEVMKYEIVPDAQYGSMDNLAWNTLGGLGAVSLAGESIGAGNSKSFTTTSVNVPMAPEAEHFFALAIHMDEEAGNEYQAGEVDFDIKVLATQYTHEEDSFDDQYDANADETPDNANFFDFTTVSANVASGAETKIGDVETNGVQAIISADAVESATSLSLIVSEDSDSDAVITVTTGSEAQYLDISLKDQNGATIESFEENGYADVQLDIGTGYH